MIRRATAGLTEESKSSLAMRTSALDASIRQPVMVVHGCLVGSLVIDTEGERYSTSSLES